MKKLIILLLVVLLAVPVSSSAVAPFLYEGAWTNTASLTDGVCLTTIYLEEDGTAYFMTQMFRSGEVGIGRAFVGTWEPSGSDYVHVTTGNNSSVDLLYCTFNMMYDEATRAMYFRAEMRDDDRVKK